MDNSEKVKQEIVALQETAKSLSQETKKAIRDAFLKRLGGKVEIKDAKEN